jgi:saccharopine dehydrogenase-like NADP-dependent oxidoreductase
LENNKIRNKTKKLNIAVIGSGATALGVIKTLLEKKKFNITVISKSINEQNKIFKKKD